MCVRKALILGLGVLSLTGCVKYRPGALNPPALETEYRARSLTAPALVAFLRQNGQVQAAWPPGFLDLRTLALIAYFYNPDLAVARSRFAAAEAGVAVAGLSPSPSVAIEGGYNPNPESRVLYGVFPSFTIETAGKRGLRILQAQKLAESARAGLAESGWLVRSRVRTSLFNYVVAERRRTLLETEVAVRTEIVGIFDKRVSVGESPRPELDIYRVDLLTTRSALDAALGEAAQARMALASAVGLSGDALADRGFRAPELDAPVPPTSLPIRAVQKAGVLHRADIRRALADYGAADAVVRLEIARQYPDVQLTPSYSFEEGFARYVLNAGLQPLSGARRRKALIAQAEAAREHAATQFEALQARAIGEMDRALEQYKAAYLAWQTAGARLVEIQTQRETAARRALEAGEGDRLGLAVVRLESITAARAQLDALARLATALAAVEDAMQQPLEAALEIGDVPAMAPQRGIRPGRKP
jgi:cobalt-zinc-cadmium efflux system outer membrane protein